MQLRTAESAHESDDKELEDEVEGVNEENQIDYDDQNNSDGGLQGILKMKKTKLRKRGYCWRDLGVQHTPSS